jgi:type II secretory pathway component PulK
MALILALLLVAAVALFALTGASRARNVSRDAVCDRAKSAARAAATGAIERARWALSQDPGYTGETTRLEEYDIVIRIDRAESGTCTASAVATVPAAPFAETVTRRVEARLATSGDALPRILAWRE